MKPVKIKKSPNGLLHISWDDGHESIYWIQYLREICPCASCQGETILFKTYKSDKVDLELPGKYELKNIRTVGNYAIQIFWLDGHDTGIYSFEFLKKICQCDICKRI
jgi:DUF971 family protein